MSMQTELSNGLSRLCRRMMCADRIRGRTCHLGKQWGSKDCVNLAKRGANFHSHTCLDGLLLWNIIYSELSVIVNVGLRYYLFTRLSELNHFYPSGVGASSIMSYR